MDPERDNATPPISRDEPHSTSPFTDRQVLVLRLVANGFTNKEIGYRLGISAETAKHHVCCVLQKIQAKDRAHAVSLAFCNGWLSTDSIDTDPHGYFGDTMTGSQVGKEVWQRTFQLAPQKTHLLPVLQS